MRKEAKRVWIMLLIGCIAVFATYKILFPVLKPPPPPASASVPVAPVVTKPSVWHLEFEIISPDGSTTVEGRDEWNYSAWDPKTGNILMWKKVYR